MPYTSKFSVILLAQKLIIKWLWNWDPNLPIQSLQKARFRCSPRQWGGRRGRRANCTCPRPRCSSEHPRQIWSWIDHHVWLSVKIEYWNIFHVCHKFGQACFGTLCGYWVRKNTFLLNESIASKSYSPHKLLKVKINGFARFSPTPT